MELKFYVNHKTRICRVLHPGDLANLADTEKQGFVEVTGPEQDAFRAETKKAVDAGWKPAGRIGYEKFMEKHGEAE